MWVLLVGVHYSRREAVAEDCRLRNGGGEYHFGRGLAMSIWPPNRLFASRRIAQIVLVVAAFFELSGCWVTSIKPLFENATVDNNLKKDPDLVFEPSILVY